MIWINYKTYERGIGDKGLELATICEEVSEELDVPIAVCPQTADILRLGQRVNIELWAQHVDPVKPGRNTGFILPETILHAGASGVLINHSEHPLPLEKIKKTVDRCLEVGLKTMIFAATLEKVRDFDSLSADYIALEPPALVAGDVSVSTAEAGQIKQSIDAVVNSNLVVGAGVHGEEDVKKSIELGAQGVLISSAIMEKTDDPRTLLFELAEAFE